MSFLNKNSLVCSIALTALLSVSAQASSVFDGSNSNLWLLDGDEGRITGYNLNNPDNWLEQFAPNNVPVFPLQTGQFALINNVLNSSLPMSPNQPAISIAGIDQGGDGNNPDGHPELVVSPASGDYGETIAVEMRVDTTIMQDDRPTLTWSIDGGAPQSVLLSKNLLQKSGAPVGGGYYTTTVYIARNGNHTVSVSLTEPNATIASASRTYNLQSTHIDGEGRDTDGDGIPDVVEAEIGLDPLSDDWLVDADGNGWSEFDEWLRTECLDPLTQLAIPGSNCHDADGLPVDSDNDGWSDFDEILRGTNHLDPEPAFAVQPPPVNKTGGQNVLAPTEVLSTNFCTDGSTFFLDLRFYAEADDSQQFDIIVGIGADGDAFSANTPHQRIRVNFDESGAISRNVDPSVQEVGTGTPIDRWQVGLIQDFTIEATSQWNWHVYGTVPVGTEPFIAGDVITQLGIRAAASGDTYFGDLPISGDPLDCDTNPPPPPPPPAERTLTGLDYKDFPTARRLYEVEKVIRGTFAGSVTEPLPVRAVEAVGISGQALYSSLELLTADDLADVQLDAADVASRLQWSVASAEIAAGNVPTIRLPVSENAIALVEHRDAALADYSRIYKLWIGQLADVSPRSMFEQPGQPVYASAAEWRAAFIEFLAGSLAIDVPSVQITTASTRDVSLIEGVLSDESRLNNNQRTQLFATDFGSVDQDFIGMTRDAIRRFGGPDYTFDDVVAQLNALTQPGQPLQPVGDWIDTQFLTAAPGWRSDGFIASRLQQSYDDECYIETSVVSELQADPPTWQAFLERCPTYVTEVELPGILLADQQRKHALRLGFIPGAIAELAADVSLLEPQADSDFDSRINTIEINRPLPATTLPWDPDTDGDLIPDGDDPCSVDPYNICSNNPILPSVALGADVFVTEPVGDTGIVVITVVLDRASDEAVTIDYAAFAGAGDTAQDGADFTAITGSVTFAPGERVVIITVPILADVVTEGPETFTVQITGITGAIVADDGEIVVTINDPVIENYPPVFTSSATVSVIEGLTDIGYTATATDVENEVLTFGIGGGADSAAFSIDSVTGVLTFVSAPVFATPTDANGDNDYEVRLNVVDANGGSDTLDLTVSVTNATPDPIYLELTYPTPNANLGGGVATTFVRGNIVDPSGAPIEFADINYVNVNGQIATLDPTDPSRWSVEIAVAEGDNTLELELSLASGTTSIVTSYLENNQILLGLDDLAYDGSTWMYSTDFLTGVVRINVNDGTAQLISGRGVGAGTAFSSLSDLDLDVSGNRVYVLDYTRDALIAVDITSGDRSVISSNSVGTGQSLDRAVSVALLAGTNTAYVATQDNLIIEVDLTTGDRTLLSGSGAGSGVDFGRLRSIVAGPAGQLYALDSSPDSVLRVDLSTGERTVVSDDTIGTGANFRSPGSISYVAETGKILVADSLAGAMVVDEATGDRTVLSAPTADYGNNGSRVAGIAANAMGTQVFFSDGRVDALFAISYPDGERTIVFDSATGTADELSILFGIGGTAYSAETQQVLAIDSYKKYLWGIDLATTNRSVLSSNSSTGPSIDFPGKMVVDGGDGVAYALEKNRRALMRIDLNTGDRVDVSGASAGTGPSFSGVQDLALDRPGNRAFIVDGNANTLFEVDLASGNRRIVSNAATGVGPLLSAAASIAYDAANNRVLVLDWSLDSLIAVDLATGDRTVISDNAGAGSGPAFNIPFDVALDADNNRVLYVDYGRPADALIAVDLASGDRTVISDASTGSGVDFQNPQYIEFDAANQRAFVYDVAVTGIIVVDLLTGDRAVMAK